MLQPVTYMKPVVETVYEPAQVKVPRTVYETVYVNEEVELFRVVCETEMREQQYQVCRTVTETNEREITQTIREPKWVTVDKKFEYQERKLVRETSEREIRRKTYKPVTEEVTRTGLCPQDRAGDRETDGDRGSGAVGPSTGLPPGPLLPGLGPKPCGQLGLPLGPGGGFPSSRLQWCPNPVTREVTCTRYVTGSRPGRCR
ncbi:MAG: hypothetical protein CM1200mP2_32290 [Planctomycetaceae bacterium]|nr:MAG: hypothetical protein CM1200mP2_32290 [Planctomycetaceae bacterium]